MCGGLKKAAPGCRIDWYSADVSCLTVKGVNLRVTDFEGVRLSHMLWKAVDSLNHSSPSLSDYMDIFCFFQGTLQNSTCSEL